MAPLPHSSFRKVLLLLPFLALLFFTFAFISVYSSDEEVQPNSNIQSIIGGSRRLLEAVQEDIEDQPIKKKKSLSSSSSSSVSSTSLSSSKNKTKLLKATTGSASPKNQTSKLIKPSISTSGLLKNQTKLIKLKSESSFSKNKTKLLKPTSDSIPADDEATTFESQLKKLNSTSSKSLNSPKTTSLLTKKSSDLSKAASSPKTKTTKPFTSKESKTQLEKNPTDTKSENPDKNQSSNGQKPKQQTSQKKSPPSWFDQEDEDDDLISEFRDLPSKFQESFIPDMNRISSTSKLYLNRANKQITKGVKPIVGNKYAPTIASLVSFAFIIIPLILVSLIFNRIKAYFSLQKLLIFIQIYLSIYFFILCLSSLLTGLEPLRFFYATSQSTYICLQVLQTLAYVLYLLMLLMYLVLVFSTETGPATKLLGLAQTFVGFSVGLHYYMTVFHRAVLRQPPKTSWKVHALYATCFMVICLLARADRTKKAYLEEGGQEGKKS